MPIATQTFSELEYEPVSSARPVTIERDGQITRVTLAMTGLYGPVPKWLAAAHVLGIAMMPFWWLGAILVRRVMRRAKPPRAVFEFEGAVVRLTTRNSFDGEVARYHFPRKAIVEIRLNRFENGLWFDVPGYLKQSMFPEVSVKTLTTLEIELQRILAQTGSADA